MIRRLFVAILVLAFIGGGGAIWWRLRGNDPADIAAQLAAKGDLRGALVQLREAVRKHDSADLHLSMAQLLTRLADPIAAEREFRLAASQGADQAAIVPQIGSLLITQGRFSDVLARVPARSPTPVLAAKNLLLRGIAQLSLNDLPAAETTLRAAESQAPDRAETLLLAARVAAARNDVATTEAKLDKALQSDPDLVEALLMKQSLLTARGDRDGAMARLDRAITAAPWSGMAHLDRANLLMAAGKDDQAMTDVQAVLSLQPRSMEATYLNAILLARRGEYGPAAAQLAKLDPSAKQFPQAVYYEGMIAEQLGQAEAAAEFARRYAALVPTDPQGVRLLGRTALAVKRPQIALPALEAAVKDGPASAETWDLLGSVRATMGDRPGALAAFQTAASLAPEEPRIQAHLGMARLLGNDAAGAAAALERALSLNQQQPDAREALVSAALDLNDVAKAGTELDRLRVQAGDTEAVAILTSRLLQAKADYAGAADILAIAQRRFPDSPRLKLQLARILIAQERQPDAQRLLTEMLRQTPADVEALKLYLGILSRTGQASIAVLALDAARQANPQEPAFIAMLADAQTDAGNPDKAIATLRAMPQTEASPPFMLAALGRAQAAAGRFDEAKTSLQAALKAAPNDIDSRSRLVRLLLRERDNPGIRDTLTEGLAVSPGNLPLMSALVANEAAARDLDAGLALATKLRENPANLPFAAALKGDLLLEYRRPADAAQAFLTEYRAIPSLPLLTRSITALMSAGRLDDAAALAREWLATHADDPLVTHNLAQIEILLKHYDKAQALLGTILDKTPEDATVLNDLAWIYSQIGDKRALATARRAYLLSPSPAIADTMAWIMVAEGDRKAAIPILQQAVAQRSADLAIRYHLAVALQGEGQFDQARAVLQPLQQNAAPFPERAAAETLVKALARP